MSYALYLNDPKDHWVLEKLKQTDMAGFQQDFFIEYASNLRVSLEPLLWTIVDLKKRKPEVTYLVTQVVNCR